METKCKTGNEAGGPSLRGLSIGCLAVLGAVALLLAALVVCLCLSYADYCKPRFERTPSPDGRYEIIRRERLTFLDGYVTLWIAMRGEQDEDRWFLIAPEVNGSWHTEWLKPTELMLTDHGAWPEERMPYGSVTWRDVRIETRARPFGSSFDSPDEQHSVWVWTYVDSYGRRSAARLDTTWQNPKNGCVHLVEEGPWEISAEWPANDRLVLRIVPLAGDPVPKAPSTWRGVTITVKPGQ